MNQAEQMREAAAQAAEEEGWTPGKPKLGHTEREEGSRDCAERIAEAIRALPLSPTDPLADPRVKALVEAGKRAVRFIDHLGNLSGTDTSDNAVRVQLLAALRGLSGEGADA